MEAEEDAPVGLKAQLTSGARSINAGPESHKAGSHQHNAIRSQCSVAVDQPSDEMRASFAGPQVAHSRAVPSPSVGGGAAAETPADLLSAVPAGAVKLPEARTCEDVCATPAAVTHVAPTALYNTGEADEPFEARQEPNMQSHPAVQSFTSAQERLFQQSVPVEWSDLEERAGVVSRVLQVLRCESLLREARKVLQSAHAEMRDGEVEFRTAPAERKAVEQKGFPARVAASGTVDDGTSCRGSGASAAAQRNGGASATKGTAVGVDRPLPKSSAAVTGRGDREGKVLQASASRGGGAFAGYMTSSLCVQPCVWQDLHTPAYSPTVPTCSSSRARERCQNEQQVIRRKSETARRSVWMRGERSEDDLQDDCKIKALRALIPEILAVIPEWLDRKLDTGRRGEWLGFERVIPRVLSQRFGFTGEELLKDGPFCWKGSRRAPITEVSMLLWPSSAVPQDSHAEKCRTRNSEGGATRDFPQIHQEPEHKQDQAQLHCESNGGQQQYMLTDAFHKQNLHQPRAQQQGPPDLRHFAEGFTIELNEGCSHMQQTEERFHSFEAMDVDEETGRHSGQNSSCRGASDDKRDYLGDICGINPDTEAAQPIRSNPCGGRGDHNRSSHCRFAVSSQEDTTVVLEVTSVWVNGFQESGKPYDVHVQARVDGHLARDFYVEVKATVGSRPYFVLSWRQLEFARSRGPDDYLILLICRISAGSPAWMVLDNVVERVSNCLRPPLPATVNTSLHTTTAAVVPHLQPDLSIRCCFDEQANVSNPATSGQLTDQNVDDILWCLLRRPCL